MNDIYHIWNDTYNDHWLVNDLIMILKTRIFAQLITKRTTNTDITLCNRIT